MPVADALAWTYGLAALALALAAFHDAPLRWVRAHREGRVLEDRAYHAVNAVSILVVAAWLAALLAGLDHPLPGELGSRAAIRGLGLAIGLAGFGLALWARLAMGRAFAPTAAVPPEEQVVEEGPFARVRHPFYLGMLLALAGGALVLDSLATLACLAALIPLVEVLARHEETHLADELGEAYRAYRERVPRWLPRP